MVPELTQEQILELQRVKREELEGEFHVWLQSHFDASEDTYINAIVAQIDDDAFCEIAEAWATATKRNKVFY